MSFNMALISEYAWLYLLHLLVSMKLKQERMKVSIFSYLIYYKVMITGLSIVAFLNLHGSKLM